MSTVLSASARPLAGRDLSNFRSFKIVAEQNAILSIGRDPKLLASRAAVLRVSGRPVYSATPEQAFLLGSGGGMKLVVLGHSLANAEVVKLAGFFRGITPRAKLMLTCFDPRPSTVCALFDGCVASVDGPAVLVGAVRRLLAEDGSEGQYQA